DKVEAAAIRQHQMDQRQRNGLAGQACQGVGKTGSEKQRIRRITKLPQYAIQTLLQKGLVLDHQHRRRQNSLKFGKEISHTTIDLVPPHAKVSTSYAAPLCLSSPKTGILAA